MLRKTVSGIMIVLFLTSLFLLSFKDQLIKAETPHVWTWIRIREPGTYLGNGIVGDIETNPNATQMGWKVPIQGSGGLYTLIEDIQVIDGIYVCRNNTVIDGAGHTLDGLSIYITKGVVADNGTKWAQVTVWNLTIRNVGLAIYVWGPKNVVIENTIENSGEIHLDFCSDTYVYGNTLTSSTGISLVNSSNNRIYRNNMTANWQGVTVEQSSNNQFVNNNITDSNAEGFGFTKSHNNIIERNNLVRNGICLVASSHNRVSYNNITGNDDEGIRLTGSSNNTILKNMITANTWEGISLEGSSSNNIVMNNITANGWRGIELVGFSNHNMIGWNLVSANEDQGIELDESSNNIIRLNNITANVYNGIYLGTSSNNNCIEKNIIVKNGLTNIYPSITTGIYCGGSNNIIMENNITQNYGGIRLYGDSTYSNNTILGNIITSNKGNGISLSSSNNLIVGNNLTQNNYGIYSRYTQSSNNVIYHNNFIANKYQTSTTTLKNLWDDGYPSGGNYWSTYLGVDEKQGPGQNQTGSDGIGDTPYLLNANNTDRYPLTSLRPLDSDGDGLLDIWEEKGIDVNGDTIIDLNLPTLGANSKHKDLFIEVDYMTGEKPSQAAINRVITSFVNSPVTNPDGILGITLHVLIDEEIPFQNNIQVWSDYYSIKQENFGTVAERNDMNWLQIEIAKHMVYRYCLFIHAYDGKTWSGIAEGAPSDDFIVSLGTWHNGGGGTPDEQAGTFMHELGHTLGLHHGGDDDINYKPNYLSIMSYSRQTSRFIRNRILDYSRVELPTLNESNLDESMGIGAGYLFGWYYKQTVYSDPIGHPIVVGNCDPIDWNCNGTMNSGVQANINNLEGVNSPGGQVLRGYNDWANLQYSFRDTASYSDLAGAQEAQITEPELTWKTVESTLNSLPPVPIRLDEVNAYFKGAWVVYGNRTEDMVAGTNLVAVLAGSGHLSTEAYDWNGTEFVWKANVSVPVISIGDPSVNLISWNYRSVAQPFNVTINPEVDLRLYVASDKYIKYDIQSNIYSYVNSSGTFNVTDVFNVNNNSESSVDFALIYTYPDRTHGHNLLFVEGLTVKGNIAACQLVAHWISTDSLPSQVEGLSAVVIAWNDLNGDLTPTWDEVYPIISFP